MTSDRILMNPRPSGLTKIKGKKADNSIMDFMTFDPDAQTITPKVPMVYGTRNYIINGDMGIDQRNAGALITGLTSPQYLVDRFRYRSTSTGKFNAQQNHGSVSRPAQLKNYLGFISNSSYAYTSTDRFTVSQPIEGNNVVALALGSSFAKTVTLSFWVRSSIAGIASGALRNGAEDRYYAFEYTISATNTWEYKSITINLDQTGTWTNDSNIGLEVYWSLGCGSNLLATPNTWGTGEKYGSSNETVKTVATSGATFYITNVMLNEGPVAAPFERAGGSIGAEELLCKRYYWKLQGTGNHRIALGIADTASRVRVPFVLSHSMRTTPTVDFLNLQIDGGAIAVTTVSVIGISSLSVIASVAGTPLVSGTAYQLSDNVSVGYIAFSSEL